MLKAEIATVKDQVHDRLIAGSQADSRSECTLWRGDQYAIKVDGRAYRPHKVAAWVWRGGFELDDPAIDVKQSCQNARCINESHLIVRTVQTARRRRHMRIRVVRKDFLASVEAAAAACAARDIKPVLRNVKIEALADADTATVSGTDLEIGVRATFTAGVPAPGVVLVNGAKLAAVLKQLEDEEVVLDIDDANRCTVRGNTDEFEMPTEDASAFPDLPDGDREKALKLPGKALARLIRRTVFAAARSDTNARYAATMGVLFEVSGTTLRLVGTDGRRLATDTVAVEVLVEHATTGSVVPTKALLLLQSRLADDEGDVYVSLRDNDVLFASDTLTVYARLVDGKFPNWKHVMPKAAAASDEATVRPGVLAGATRAAAIMGDEESQGVNFTLDADKVVIQASGSSTGRSVVERPLVYSGAKKTARLMPKFVGELLSALDGAEDVRVSVQGAASPVVFSQGEFRGLIVPLVVA